MLILTRRPGEEIIIGNDVRVQVVAIKGNQVRIAIFAPDVVAVDRAEIRARKDAQADALRGGADAR